MYKYIDRTDSGYSCIDVNNQWSIKSHRFVNFVGTPSSLPKLEEPKGNEPTI